MTKLEDSLRRVLNERANDYHVIDDDLEAWLGAATNPVRDRSARHRSARFIVAVSVAVSLVCLSVAFGAIQYLRSSTTEPTGSSPASTSKFRPAPGVHINTLHWTPNTVDEAGLKGTLRVSAHGCLYLESLKRYGSQPLDLVWPKGTTVKHSASGQTVVVDSGGTVIGVVGRLVDVGGGDVPPGNRPVPLACRASSDPPFYIQGQQHPIATGGHG